MSSARLICIANQKGGVGKTTTTLNLAAALAHADSKVCVVDLDPQCNATTGLGCQPAARHPLVCEEPLSETMLATYLPTLKLIPGCRGVRDIAALADGDETSSALLRNHLLNGLTSFDYVLLDCPPSLGKLTHAALAVSTEVLMPIQCEYFAMEGLTQMIEVIRDVMKSANTRLAFGGILLTMYDPSLELTHEVDGEVRDFFGEIVFETVIPRDVACSEAASHGKSVIDFAPRSRAARGYIELCMEVLERD